MYNYLEDFHFWGRIASGVDHKGSYRIFDEFRISKFNNKYRMVGFFTLFLLSSAH